MYLAIASIYLHFEMEITWASKSKKWKKRMDHRNEVKTRELSNQTYHKEILHFSSTEFRCGHQAVGHSDSRKYEDHVQEHQQVVLLVYPT